MDEILHITPLGSSREETATGVTQELPRIPVHPEHMGEDAS
jgi:hypothetical protein